MRTLGIEEAEGDVGLLEVRTKNRNLEAARNLGAVDIMSCFTNR